MTHLLCWLTVLAGMGIHELINDSLTANEFAAATWFGGCMLALHYIATRSTQSNE